MGQMKPAKGQTAFSRRQFVVTAVSAGGGLAVGVLLPRRAMAFPLSAQPWNDTIPADELSAWVVIDPDETVTVRIPHSEMGQGTATGLAMLLAEELQCDWSKIKGEFASANRNVREHEIYGDQNTVGSRGIRTSVERVQQAGASARVRLIAAAATQWGVSEGECSAVNGVVAHKASNRSLSYGKLAPMAAHIHLPAEPAIKTPDQYTLVGKSLPRLDTPVKVDGTAKFGIDTRLPGMVYAAVMSCPVMGGTLVSVDETPIAGRRGILRIVRLPDAVSVVADSYWRAESALRALKITWDYGAGRGTDTDQFKTMYRKTLDEPMVQARKDGDPQGALSNAANVHEAVYEAPLLAHATMEPLNATVHLQNDRLDVWIGTQSALGTLEAAAKASGLKPEQVYIHNCYLGGGFGRRSRNDEMLHAIAVAKVIGDTPVKLLWSREQDVQRDRFRPQAAAHFKAALAPDGSVSALDARVAVASINRSIGRPVPNGLEPQAVDAIANSPYTIPNFFVGGVLKNTHILVNFWRSVGGSQNCFFYESFVDELAHAAGKDPLAFRRAMLKRRDFIDLIDLLAEKSNWGSPLPKGRGRGIAVCENHHSVIGHVAEVTVDDDGTVHVDKVVAALDCYHVVNPSLVEAQIEGGIIFGLTAALYGENTVRNGEIVERNFDTYRMVRLAEAPVIETYLSLTGGSNWGGVGEPSVAPIAPAVTNAIFAATGKRVRQLPLKNVRLSDLASL